MQRQRRNTDVATLRRLAPGAAAGHSFGIPLGSLCPVPSGTRGSRTNNPLKEIRANLTIVISGIPNDLSEDSVEQVFRRFGDIVSVDRDTTHDGGAQTWQCLIQYRSFDDARNAVQNMDNHELVKDTPPVTVRFSRANSISPSIRRRRGSSAERETTSLENLFLME